jgi:hypothetical protein
VTALPAAEAHAMGGWRRLAVRSKLLGYGEWRGAAVSGIVARLQDRQSGPCRGQRTNALRFAETGFSSLVIGGANS